MINLISEFGVSINYYIKQWNICLKYKLCIVKYNLFYGMSVGFRCLISKIFDQTRMIFSKAGYVTGCEIILFSTEFSSNLLINNYLSNATIFENNTYGVLIFLFIKKKKKNLYVYIIYLFILPFLFAYSNFLNPTVLDFSHS